MTQQPTLIEPSSGQQIDALAPTFSWTSVPGTDSYEIQFSERDSFDVPLVHTSVSDATSLTLYEALPTDGRPVFWRVRASQGKEAHPWTAASSFVSGRSQQAAANTARAARKTSPAAVASSAAPATAAQYASGVTSAGEMWMAFAVLVLTIVIIAVGIAVLL